MTNQEVINFLDQVREILLDDKSWLESTIQPINEAFDIAISALQTQDLQPTSNQLATDTISRKAAINALCRRCDLAAEDDEPCTEKCNDIKILEKLPSAQSEPCEDAVSRKAAIEAVMDLCKHYTPTKSVNHPHVDFVIEALQDLPSAQPEIVRCKDCRKHNVHFGYKEDCCALYEWRGMSYGHEHDYQYCSHAERRTDERTD